MPIPRGRMPVRGRMPRRAATPNSAAGLRAFAIGGSRRRVALLLHMNFSHVPSTEADAEVGVGRRRRRDASLPRVRLVPALVVEERVPIDLVTGKDLFQSPRVRGVVIAGDTPERTEKFRQQTAYLVVSRVTT